MSKERGERLVDLRLASADGVPHVVSDIVDSLNDQNNNIEGIKTLGIEIERVTAGLDPEESDKGSLDYAFGVKTALSSMHTRIERRERDYQEYGEIIEVNGGDEMILFIGVNAGKSLSSLVEISGQGFLEFGRKFAKLQKAGLINISMPLTKEKTNKRRWALSSDAIEVFVHRVSRRLKSTLYGAEIINRL